MELLYLFVAIAAIVLIALFVSALALWHEDKTAPQRRKAFYDQLYKRR